MIKTYLFINRSTGHESPTSGGAVLTGVATKEQLEDWKRQYKTGIYAVEGDGHIAYFRNPNRNDINASFGAATKDPDNTLALYETCAEITFLGGSREMLTVDGLFFGLMTELKKKIDGRKVLLKNL